MVGVRLKRKPTPKWVYTSLFAEGKSAIPQYAKGVVAKTTVGAIMAY